MSAYNPQMQRGHGMYPNYNPNPYAQPDNMNQSMQPRQGSPEQGYYLRYNNSMEKSSNMKAYGSHSSMQESLGRNSSAEQEETNSFGGSLARFLCCCIPRRPLYRIICALVILVILGSIGALAYIFFPQFPVIHVNNFDFNNLGNGAFKFSIPDNSSNLNHMQLQLSFNLDLTTYNPNMYGLQVDVIELVAQLMVNTSYVYNSLKTQPLTSFASLATLVGPPPSGRQNYPNYYPSNTSQIGTGRVNSVYFPPKGNVSYTMSFMLSYTPDPVVGLLNDPTILEIADGCGITSRYTPPGRLMKIQYTAKAAVSALQPLGYNPTVQNNIYFACPVSTAQINAVISAVANGQSGVGALQSILGGTS